jgi:hypothetical protein
LLIESFLDNKLLEASVVQPSTQTHQASSVQVEVPPISSVQTPVSSSVPKPKKKPSEKKK